MPSDQTKGCPKHSNDAVNYDDSELNAASAIMSKLPANQGFPGRHKCAYCGYKLGFDDGYAAALSRFENLIQAIKS